MAGYLINIEKVTLDNTRFRQVLFTGSHAQLVVMALKPGEDIGLENPQRRGPVHPCGGRAGDRPPEWQ